MAIGPVAISIDCKKHEVTPGLIQGGLLLQIAGLSGAEQLLLEAHHELDVPVGATDYLLIRGGEEFSIGDGQPPIEDNPCLRHPVRFHLNEHLIAEEKALHHPKVLGSQIKALDSTIKPGDGLFADLKHLADEPIRDDQRIIVQKHDEFITTPCGNVGEGGVVFDHLDQVRSVFPEAVIQEGGGNRYLLIPNLPVPDFWNVERVTMLLLVPNGYPAAAMDMFWVSPALRLKDGREPGGSSHEDHLGQHWHRFSWHYTDPQAGWQPGRSTLLTHVRFAQSRLAKAM